MFDCVTPLFFVYYVITYPSKMPKWLGLPLAFFLGVAIDMFSNTPGLSSASLTLTAFIQPYLLQLYQDKESRDDLSPSIATMGWMKFSTFSFFLTTVFCIVYFTLDAFNFDHILLWLCATGGSWLLTYIFILVIDSVKKA